MSHGLGSGGGSCQAHEQAVSEGLHGPYLPAAGDLIQFLDVNVGVW